MTTTIELAKKAGIFRVDMYEPDTFGKELEAFRALCVAERDRELMGVGMEPQGYKFSAPGVSKIDVCKHGGDWFALYSADQLAAARLLGREEEKLKAYDIASDLALAKQRVTDLESQLVGANKLDAECNDLARQLNESNERNEKLILQLAEVHAVLDADESKIIRNAKDGYPEGREPKELTLAERVAALCKYAADWKRWNEQAESQRDEYQKEADRLAAENKCFRDAAMQRVSEFAQLQEQDQMLNALKKAKSALESAVRHMHPAYKQHEALAAIAAVEGKK